MAAALERDNGRVRGAVKFSDRTLDVDLVYFDDLVLDLPQLHCRGRNCAIAFVLRPLADIAPDFVDPVRGETLARTVARASGPRRADDTRAALDLSIRPPSSRSTWPVV
jgi:7,8-dihydro-6-hydroxymethylpterin-pyrophosphokinase